MNNFKKYECINKYIELLLSPEIKLDLTKYSCHIEYVFNKILN